MRPVSNDFQEHLDGETITICNCWRIIKADGTRLGFTDHDVRLEFDNLLFEAASGFQASQMESSSGLTPDNHEIMGALQSDSITPHDIESRVYDSARIEHFVVNWMHPDERILMQTYLLGEITRQDGVFKAELKSLTALLDQTNVNRFERRCNATLGDAKCGIDLAGMYSVQGTVERVVLPDLIYVNGLENFPNGWFAGGTLNFLSGENAGQKLQIANSANSNTGSARTSVNLWSVPLNRLAAGDEITALPGCDKLIGTCQEKFSNALNFRGFPHMPGSDFAMSYANNSDNMDGGPLVP